jgi:hypothetical protein
MRCKVMFGVLVLAVVAGALGNLTAGADTIGPIDFEGYTVGSVYGQGAPAWTGGGCGSVDQAVVDNSGFPAAPASFGTKSFRLSNSTVLGCFNDAFTSQTVNEAGESTAQSSPLSGGTRQPFFETSFTFASATGALQPGLAVQVSPDRGDGARMSYVRMQHTATDLVLDFYDVQGVVGTAPCLSCANFVNTPLGTYDPTVPHTVKITMQFVDGPSNDIVQVFVDGVLKHTGGSWEDYYTMDTESSPAPPMLSRTVDSLLIRASGTATPSLAGKGFLFDGVSILSGPVPIPVEVSPEVVTAPGAVELAPRFTG